MNFYPIDKEIPETLETAEFILFPLKPGHVHIDYDAVMSSREMLRMWSGGPWPREDFPLSENLADLEEHDQEHQDRIAFTYTVLDPSQEKCLGCLYIRPLTELIESNPGILDSAGENEAVARFWVRTPLIPNGLDRRLLKALIKWFDEEWAFSTVHFHTRTVNDQQIALFEEAKLEKSMTLNYSERGGYHYFYRAIPLP